MRKEKTMKLGRRLLCFLMGAGLAVQYLTGCTRGGAEASAPLDTTTESNASAQDYEVGYDAADATTIICHGDTAGIDGGGAVAEEGVITISQAGTYVISGELEGSLVVQAENQSVHLVLGGFTAVSNDGPAIHVRDAEKVILTLEAGTDNSLADGTTYTLEAGEDEPNACLYAKSDLTVNGNGAIKITGSYNHGIYCKDALFIAGGSLSIEAANDGIKGKNSVTILTADVAINAGGDGIQSNGSGDPTYGWIRIEDGTFQITAAQDGIQAESALEIDGGSYSIETGGGSANAVMKSDGTRNPQWGSWGEAESADDTSVSAKGLKAGTALNLSGGSFSLDTSDDALHSNGSLTVSGGDFTIATGDDGAHADEALEITSGTIEITYSYEGLEGCSVTISGGSITIQSVDDGINAAGGSNGTMGLDFDQFGTSSDYFLRITGGEIEIDASGDGLDSNGPLYVAGGTIYISGPTSGADGALDYESIAEVSGGVVIAVSSVGMTAGFTDSSTQASFLTAFDASVPAGTETTVTDSTGTVICSYTPTKDYQAVVISAPTLQVNKTYTVTAGEQSMEVTLTTIATNANVSPGGMQQPGRGNGPGGMGGTPGEFQTAPEGGFQPPDGQSPGFGDFPGAAPESSDGSAG